MFVVLLGGDAIAHEHLTSIVHDLALLSVLGARVVLVHGARQQIDQVLTAAGLTPRSHRHRPILDQAGIELAQSAVGRVRAQIEGLFSMGLPNTPLHNTDIQVLSGNLVIARPLGVLEGVDHLFTGQVRRIHVDIVHKLLEGGAIVLVSPIGYSPSGEAFSLSAEELSADIAIAIGADKLISFNGIAKVSDTEGVLRTELTPDELETVLKQKALDDTTRRRLAELLRASRAGVHRCHLIDFHEDGALLRELYTAQGSGTQISEESFTLIRRATFEDVAGIVELIRPLERAGVLVRRSRDRLEREIERFFVAEIDGVLVGCCALYPYDDSKTAELACLATHPGYRQQTAAVALGTTLVRRMEAEARRLGINSLFVLTTQTSAWFQEQGFREAAIDDLPTPKKALYNFQRNSKVLTKEL